MIITNKADFVHFYHESYGFVLGKAQRLLGVPDEAHEVVQEAFLRAWKRRGQLATVESPLAWMFATTTNLCIDRLRRRRIALTKAPAIQRGFAPIDPARSEGFEALWMQLRRQRRLTQQIVIHVAVYEMTQHETAKALGISRKTVQRHVERFRQVAREALPHLSTSLAHE